nr:MAG TPA: hypothetical protein [Crassvirales sp.]
MCIVLFIIQGRALERTFQSAGSLPILVLLLSPDNRVFNDKPLPVSLLSLSRNRCTHRRNRTFI